jgi:hypothetical protein
VRKSVSCQAYRARADATSAIARTKRRNARFTIASCSTGRAASLSVVTTSQSKGNDKTS